MAVWSSIYLDYLKSLDSKAMNLGADFRTMNPYKTTEVWDIVEQFYRKYYSDSDKRTLLFGINPGRLGAGATGIPFTDTKHLESDCGIGISSLHTHEPSSVFVYEVIRALGGPMSFYRNFLITSLSPLGFLAKSKKGSWLNVNYYDHPELLHSSLEFIKQNLRWHANQYVNREVAFCLGTGKNFLHFEKLNREGGFFKEIIPLEHPRFVMQYKFKEKNAFVDKYVNTLRALG